MARELTTGILLQQGGSQAQAARADAQIQQARADIAERMREASERAREAQVRAVEAHQAARAAQLDARGLGVQVPDAPGAPGTPDLPLPPAPTRIVVQDGRVIVSDVMGPPGGGSGGGGFVTTTGTPMGPGPNEIPPQVVDIVQAFFTMLTIIAIGIPLIKLVGRWMERRHAAAPALSPDVTQRLERIEQAVETVAVEVERISEGQRFTTKLMAELRQSSALPQLEGVRVAEPQQR